MFARVFAVSFALFASAASTANSQSFPPRSAPDSPVVETLAGSGSVGIADGPGALASFVAPAGIAFDERDNLIVADRDAQRIRIVSKSGAVSTLAGAGSMIALGIAAAGGYRDGPAATALFDMPTAVLPLEDGSVLVADTNNHCIRRISNGMVSTFAGAQAAGIADGMRQDARFARPVSLARDRAGDVFVADPPNGLRRIDLRGRVTTLAFQNSQSIVAVSSIPDAPQYLLVASVATIERLNTQSLAVDQPFPLEANFRTQPDSPGQRVNREGLVATGPLSALASLADGAFVFTDALDSAVRFGQSATAQGETINYTRVLSAVPPENASLGIAGFRDGPGQSALFDEPVGIAISHAGTIAVADTGNRRIRILSTFNRLTHLSSHDPAAGMPTEPNPHEYRVAIVGNSMIWLNQAWHESLPGITEDALVSMPHGVRQPRVIPVMRIAVCTPVSLDLIDAELSNGLVDMVVLDLTTFGQVGGDGYAGLCYTPNWEADLRKRLLATTALLKSQHVGFLVVNFPGPSDFPDEYAYFRVPKGPSGDSGFQNEPADVQSYHDAIAAVLAETQVPTLDLWPAFLQAYDAPDHVPLFDAWDHHLSLRGRQLVGTAIARQLLIPKN